jgi:predicted house-cleaning noncanonical NTP pyrophosphatase (MazG superfamily)
MNSKIVRDNIPSIIKKDGKKPIVKLANHDQKIKLLKLKLVEEAEEAQKAYSKKLLVEELADLMQVITSLSEELDINFNQIQIKMRKKAERRGEFKKGYILEEII